MNLKKKMKIKIAFDILLNIIATAIPVVVLQLIIFPLVSQRISSDDYGFLLTIVSLLNMCPGTIASAINNIRLLENKSYIDDNLEGDFNLMLYISIIINALVVVITMVFLKNTVSIYEILAVVLISVIWIFQNYYLVEFRIVINYKAVLINNIYMVLGYLLGYLIFYLTNSWLWIYIIGQFAGLLHIFIFSKMKLWKEKIYTTKRFKKTLIEYVQFIIASFLARSSSFADRLLLFPIMGGTIVSVYYAATVFGKIISMAIAPVTGVILSYLALSKKNPRKTFNQMLLTACILGVAGYVVTILISRPILNILYPQFVDESMKYIFVTTASLVISVLASLVNPFVLKYYSMKYQIYVNGIVAAIYVFIGLFLLIKYGLMGFCYGTLIANVLQLFLLLFVYYGKA